MEKGEISQEEQFLEKRKKKLINWFKNKYNLALFSLLVFTVFVRVYYFFMTQNQPLWWDEAEYMVIARNWATGIPNILDPVRQVLFPFIISIFFKISETEFLTRFLVLILSIASVAGTYFLGKEMFDKKVGLIASFLISVFYLNIFFSYRILVDIHSLAFFTFSAWLFYKYFKENSPKYLYIAAVIIGIGTMFKLTTAYLLFAVLIYLLLTEKLNFLKKKEIWISAIIFWLVIFPYILWGYITFHGFVLTKAAAATAPTDYISSTFRVLGNYLTLFPNYILPLNNSNSLLWFVLAIAIIALIIISTYRLFIGFDILVNKGDKELKRDLYLLLIFLSPLILVSIMISHNEDRYILNSFPALFIMIGAIMMNIFNYFSSKKLKFLAFLFLIIAILSFAYTQLNSADSLIKVKLESYSQVRDAGLWFNENSGPTDSMATVSVSQVRYYSKKETLKIPDTEEEFQSETIPEKHPKYFMLSGFEQGPEWSRSYPQKKNLSIANVFFIDPAKTQPVVIIYNIPENSRLSNIQVQEIVNQTGINKTN